MMLCLSVIKEPDTIPSLSGRKRKPWRALINPSFTAQANWSQAADNSETLSRRRQDQHF